MRRGGAEGEKVLSRLPMEGGRKTEQTSKQANKGLGTN